MADHATLLLDVEDLEPSGEGAASATVAGRRVRIFGAIPGERVEVRMGEAGVAELVRVVRPSPHRVTPRCPFFGPCGGCTWQHIAHPEQLRLKERLLESLLRQAVGDRAPRVRPTLAQGEGEWGFRNKVHFVLAPAPSSPGRRGGGLILGHYRGGSQAVIAVDQCPVHAEAGNRIAFAIRDELARAGIEGATPDGRRGIARHIVVRVTSSEAMATLVVTRNDKRLRPVVRAISQGPAAPGGLALNVNNGPGPYLFGHDTRRLHGRARARETVAGVTFLISPTAFFQTNVRAAESMVQVVLEEAGAARTALDLYAGAGLFALPMARRGARVVAVEENAEAIEDGEASRQFSRVPAPSCAFVQARAEDLAAGAHRRLIPRSPDVVVLDPPRTGCPPMVLDWICRSLRPPRVIYVSCNPQALARDLSITLAAGYTAEAVQPVDMFPHTAHIEAIAVLVR